MLIDHKLTFEDHHLNIVPKVNQKIHALARLSKYMPQKKLKITMKAFVTLLLLSSTFPANLDIS